jgi:hypothetical protein
MTAFRLFVRPLPIHFALLGRKRKYIKSKTTAKLTEKRTSIAGVRDICIVNFWHLPDPPSFSLPTTFKGIVRPIELGIETRLITGGPAIFYFNFNNTISREEHKTI